MSNSSCEACDRIAQCKAGTNLCLIAELETGFLVLGDSQFFEGYSLLLCKNHVEQPEDMSPEHGEAFLRDALRAGMAVRAATGCERVNYEMLGNTLHHLHWHLFPRRATDPHPGRPAWVQMPDRSEAGSYAFYAESHAHLIQKIRSNLQPL